MSLPAKGSIPNDESRVIFPPASVYICIASSTLGIIAEFTEWTLLVLYATTTGIQSQFPFEMKKRGVIYVYRTLFDNSIFHFHEDIFDRVNDLIYLWPFAFCGQILNKEDDAQ